MYCDTVPSLIICLKICLGSYSHFRPAHAGQVERIQGPSLYGHGLCQWAALTVPPHPQPARSSQTAARSSWEPVPSAVGRVKAGGVVERGHETNAGQRTQGMLMTRQENRRRQEMGCLAMHSCSHLLVVKAITARAQFAHHCVRLACPGLAVHEDGRVVARHHVVHGRDTGSCRKAGHRTGCSSRCEGARSLI